MLLLQYAVILLICIIIIQFIFFLVKRFKMGFKLKKECKSLGAKMVSTHLLWIFGRKNSYSNDFYIELHDKLFSVKLFPVDSRRAVLYFTERGRYFFRKHVVFVGRFGSSAAISRDSKQKLIPEYDFKKRFHEEWYLKELIPVLLIYPCRFDVLCQTTNNKSRAIDAGEMFNGMAIMRLSDFIRKLGKVNYEHSKLD